MNFPRLSCMKIRMRCVFQLLALPFLVTGAIHMRDNFFYIYIYIHTLTSVHLQHIQWMNSSSIPRSWNVKSREHALKNVIFCNKDSFVCQIGMSNSDIVKMQGNCGENRNLEMHIAVLVYIQIHRKLYIKKCRLQIYFLKQIFNTAM